MIPRNLSRSETVGALPVWAQRQNPQTILAPPEHSKDSPLEYGCVDWYLYRPEVEVALPSETAGARVH